MLTRLAGNCFWLARYLERAENNCRLLRAMQRQTLLPEFSSARELFFTALAVVDGLEDFDTSSRDTSARAVLDFMITDRNNSSSVVSCFYAVRENARSARHALTTGYWEAINSTWLEADALARSGLPTEAIDRTLDWGTWRCQWIRGAADDLLRDELPRVLALGQAVERADFIARLVGVLLADMPTIDESNPPQPGTSAYRRWMSLLEAADLTESWLRRQRSRHLGRAALRMLINDPRTTRSLITNARRMVSALEDIIGGDDSPTIHAAQDLVHHLLRLPLDDDYDLNAIDSAMNDAVQRIWAIADLCFKQHLSV